MKKAITIVLLFHFLFGIGQNKVGEKIPDYVFKTLLNGDKKPFHVGKQTKPLLLEFWATWCSPCLPAMKKLEVLQTKYGDQLEILTISSDDPKKLIRYIENTNTRLKIASDSTHTKAFHYTHIPHTILIDKNGYIQAITTPEKVADEIIEALISGKTITIAEDSNEASEFVLHKEFKNNDYQFTLTSENKKLGFKNEIKRDENNEPIALEFNNVSAYRLLCDIYQLSSVARIYSDKPISTKKKYCFKLEQASSHEKKILENAKQILNENLDLKAALIEKTYDSLLVLEVIDKSKLPKPSTKEKFFAFHGPNYKGTNITAYNLIEYLENEKYSPVKDKTGLNYTFDIELNWAYEDPKSLNKELAKYGLRVTKSPIPEKITVLEIKS